MLPIAILAGGYATRLGNLTSSIPKSLIEINGRAFIDWQMDQLIAAGYTEFVLCVSHKSELIQRHLGDGSNLGVKVYYSLDGREQLGTGGAIQKALRLLGSNFAVIYGDSYLPINFTKVEEKFLSSNLQGLITVYENRDKFDTSNVEFRQGRVIRYSKKEKSPVMHHIDYGLSYFSKYAFTEFNKVDKFDLSAVYAKLLDIGEMGGFEVFESFYEVGSIQGINNFSEHLRKNKR